MDASIFTKQHKLERKELTSFDELKDIEIATVSQPPTKFIGEIEKYGADNGLNFKLFYLNDINFLIIYKDLKFYGGTRNALSTGSGAKYLARKKTETGGLLLQYLPPKSVTSKHYHEFRTEIFHNLEGKCTLEFSKINLEKSKGTPEVKRKNLVNSTYEVEPKIVHQVKTADSAALTLLEMIGKNTGMEDHIYAD